MSLLNILGLVIGFGAILLSSFKKEEAATSSPKNIFNITSHFLYSLAAAW